MDGNAVDQQADLVRHFIIAADRPLTPTELSKRMQVPFNSASRAICQLADQELVVYFNPDAPWYRRYRLTATGCTVWRTIQELKGED